MKCSHCKKETYLIEMVSCTFGDNNFGNHKRCVKLNYIRLKADIAHFRKDPRKLFEFLGNARCYRCGLIRGADNFCDSALASIKGGFPGSCQKCNRKFYEMRKLALKLTGDASLAGIKIDYS